MATDLSDFIPDLKSEVSPPGSDFFPNASDDDYLINLQNAFWEARLDGLIASWEESNGLVTPVDTGGAEFTRDLVQVVIFYAGFRILKAALRNLQTTVRSKAGPVEFEVQQSANVMRDLISELQERRAILLKRLSDLGVIPTGYIDAVQERTNSIADNTVWWTAGRQWTTYPSNY